MSLTFTEPVIARMHGPDGEPALLEISNVRDGTVAIGMRIDVVSAAPPNGREPWIGW